MAGAALALFLVWFLVIFVARTAIQKRATGDSGVRTGALSAPIGSIEWVAGWMLVLALVAGVMAPVSELLGLGPIVSSAPLRVAGAAIAVIGIVLTLLAQSAMGKEWRIGVDSDERTGLVTDGPFVIVRNPIYGAMFTTAIGLVLMVPNWVAVVGYVLLVVSVELQVRNVEEPHLRRLHGSEYAAYESRVGRFVPGVGCLPAGASHGA
ncbi:MAG: isoprenylcysteine carboxylmethyltransferase family protein [Acidimicrobiales bacterium]